MRVVTNTAHETGNGRDRRGLPLCAGLQQDDSLFFAFCEEERVVSMAAVKNHSISREARSQPKKLGRGGLPQGKGDRRGDGVYVIERWMG
jgi:hypothetical protein